MTEQTSSDSNPQFLADDVVEPTPNTEAAGETDTDVTPNTEPLPADVDVDYDEEDVPAALERETEDGSGFNDPHELPAPDGDNQEDDQL